MTTPTSATLNEQAMAECLAAHRDFSTCGMAGGQTRYYEPSRGAYREVLRKAELQAYRARLHPPTPARETR